MESIILALWPVCALLVLGFLARLSNFPGAEFWPAAEKATYYIFFPALLVLRLSQAQLQGEEALKLIGSVLVLLGLATLLLIGLRKTALKKMEGSQWTSVYQGSVRFNTFVAFAISSQLLPDSGIVFGAVIAAVMIPTLNLLCISVFALSTGQSRNLISVLRTVLRNPLIIACLLGIGLNLSGTGLSTSIADVLKLLANVALPLGLLAVGAALQLRVLRGQLYILLLPGCIKLVLFPLLAFGVGWSFKLENEVLQTLIIFSAVPTATSAYILARQLGGDAILMAAIITIQTIVSVMTMPLMLILLS